ncbi:MAG: ComEC/Rec2 family competence protein [bacterium]|nr:ComEC/Rec2 family competence protein [bacterium]
MPLAAWRRFLTPSYAVSVNNYIFYICISGFLSGILFRSFFNFGVYFSLFLVVLAAAILLFASLSPRERGTNSTILLFAIFLFSTVFGLARYDLSDTNKGEKLKPSVGQSLFYEGIITEEPDYREKSILLTTTISKVVDSAVSEKILVNTPAGNKFNYGDKLKIFGVLQLPENFQTDTGRVFDYRKYLAKESIYYVMQNPRIEVIDIHQGNKIKQFLFDIKNRFIESFSRLISEPESSLLGGLLLGAKRALSADWQTILRNAGIIHVIVLSGYNITIVAQFLMKIFGFLTVRWRLAVGALSIIAFAIMTGGSATVVRASIMALLVLFADLIRRDYSVTRALLLAGLLMVFVNPKILVFDLSFQLSFLATVGLIYVSPIIEKYLTFIPDNLGIRTVVTATLATQIFVLPFLLYTMGNFSSVALIVNLLVLPFIPITMLAGFITGLLGLISTTLTLPFSFVSYWLLYYELHIAKFFASLPFASYIVPQFSAVIMVLIYSLLIFWIYVWQKKNATSA